MFLRRLIFLGLALVFATSGSSQVRITEFMASNTRTLQDEDKSYEDWIEIQNSGPAALNLEGWSLTDSTANPTKWRFPSTNLSSGSFLVVFASGKDRRNSGAPLHTNFRLPAGGGYLALVQADGLTVATEFTYPGQVADVSYGFGVVTTNSILVATNSSAHLRVPLQDGDAVGWQGVAFEDTAWQVIINGFGFGPSGLTPDYSQSVLGTDPVAYWRFNELSGATVATNIGSAADLDATYESGTTVGSIGPRTPTFKGFDKTNNAPTFNGTSAFVSTPRSVLNNLAAFSMGGWIKPTGTPGSRVGLFGQNDCVEFGFLAGTAMEVWTPSGGVLDLTYPFSLSGWHHVAVVGDGNALRVYLDGQLAANGGLPTSNYGSSGEPFRIGGGGIFDATGNFFKGQVDEVFVHHRALSPGEVLSLFQAGTNAVSISTASFVKADISGVMSNVNATVYARFPFVVQDPSQFSLLTLRLRYDDGYVAYLNGQEIARANAPDVLAWNSSSTASHGPATIEELRFGPDLVLPGTNVFAIQGLNLSTDDLDFLLQAELLGTTLTAESSTPSYLATATPGAFNNAPNANPGPAIQDVSHSPNVPLDNEDLHIVARVLPTFNAVSNVVLRYRIMFATPDIEVPMFDDGAHGDGAAKDGVFGASIPASASTNGQMIRYSIRAIDIRTNASRLPIFSSPAGSAEYFGTLVNPTNLTSKIPIVHLFVLPAQQSAVDGQSGGRASVFHDGEFYDNVQMQVRGNSTVGFDKKSHRIEFNREHLFRHPGPGPRIKKTSFTADYPDPAYMRQGLSFWLSTLMGAPAPFYYPMRLQLNSQFYQLANHNDVHGEELLQRLGFDPNGALYNAAGNVDTAQNSTGGFEKKTRKQEGAADYTAFAAAIAETVPLNQRRTNVFEMMDLPEIINYLVVARWVQENDDVWANMSLYHDNDGDNLWRVIPFDMNLSWGAAFLDNAANDNGLMITNDNHKSFPLYGGSQSLALNTGNFNRVYDAIFAVPETREMFLRRMRTLLDTYVLPPGTPANASLIEQKIIAWRDLIAEEALIDRAKWKWPPNGGQCNFDPGITPANGTKDILEKYFQGRRQSFYGKHTVNNTALPIGIRKDQNAGIPNAQPGDALIQVHSYEISPLSGNQDQEYVCLTNPMPYAVDVSGWQISGAIQHTFHPGTVIPANKAIYLTPSLQAFRTRTTGPGKAQALFVQAAYSGSLSARGEALSIVNSAGRIVSSRNLPSTPSDAQNYLRITRIDYHPTALAGNTNLPDAFEYIELKNISPAVTLDLRGVRFVNGVLFDFTGSLVASLAPGKTVLVVRDLVAFTARFGAGQSVAGQYSGSLDNGGERIRLVDAAGEEILDFTYGNGWVSASDGLGFALSINDPLATPESWGSRLSWHGAPSRIPEPSVTVVLPVLINEVLSRTDTPPPTDSIELFNPNSVAVVIGGWYLSDDFAVPKKFQIPVGTTLAPGGFKVFTEADFNKGATAFAFGANGDEAYLFSASATGELTGYVHGFKFGAVEDRVSFGRYVTSDGKELLVPQRSSSLGAANAGPRVGPVVISEILYHPISTGDGFGFNSIAEEFIELRNISASPVPLFDSARPTNTWTLKTRSTYSFPTNQVLAPGEFVLVVGFDPALEASRVASLRSLYGVDPSVRLFGPFDGPLNNGGEDIELRKPTLLSSGTVTSVILETISFRDGLPWPSTADGTGLSLQRLDLSSFGNDPVNWVAAVPSAGLPTGGTSGSGDPVIVVQPMDAAVSEHADVTLQVQAQGTQPLRYQWLLGGIAIPAATQSMLTLSDVGALQEGHYQVLVSNSKGSVLSGPASVTLTFPPFIVMPPRGVQVRVKPDPLAPASTNVSFTVSAYSLRPLTYQWLKEGVGLPGQTGTTLAVNGVQMQDGGDYAVRVSDGVGSTVSAPAALIALVTPVLVQGPVSQSVAAGSPVTLSVTVTGSPLPMGMEWRRGNVVLASNTVYSSTGFFTFNSTNKLTNFTYRVIVRNLAYGGTNIGPAAVVTTLVDSDQDGLPDSWEALFGLDSNLSADAARDEDLDGMTNGQEYVAGTNPLDPLSVLKLDVKESSGGVALQFTAISNRTYSVQFKESLEAATWSKLSDVVATPQTITAMVPDVGTSTNRFYRVVTPRTP